MDCECNWILFRIIPPTIIIFVTLVISLRRHLKPEFPGILVRRFSVQSLKYSDPFLSAYTLHSFSSIPCRFNRNISSRWPSTSGVKTPSLVRSTTSQPSRGLTEPGASWQLFFLWSWARVVGMHWMRCAYHPGFSLEFWAPAWVQRGRYNESSQYPPTLNEFPGNLLLGCLQRH